MEVKINKTINGITYTFDVNEEKGLDALSSAALFASMPEKCNLCGSDKIHLSSNKAEGFTFVKMICEVCGARAQLGQYKDGGYFWKSWEKYTPKEKTETE